MLINIKLHIIYILYNNFILDFIKVYFFIEHFNQFFFLLKNNKIILYKTIFNKNSNIKL